MYVKNKLLASNGQFRGTYRPAPVAQLDRVMDFESRGRRFESYPEHFFCYFHKILSFIISARTNKNPGVELRDLHAQ